MTTSAQPFMSTAAALLVAALVSGGPLAAADLLQWLEPVAARPADGAAKLSRLRPPLADGEAVRITVRDIAGLRIHVWSGTTGASLHAVHLQGPWAAYAARRADDSPLPSGRVLVARDEGRMWRTRPRAPVTFDLRHEDGLVTLSRGDVRVIEAPLSDRPTDVFLEGEPQVDAVEIVPAEPLPPLPDVRRATTLSPVSIGGESGKPRASWTSRSVAAIEPLPDGRVKLRVDDAAEPVWGMLPLEGGSPRSIVVRIDEFDVGTGIALGNASGEPTHVIRCFTAAGDPARRLLGHAAPRDSRLESAVDPRKVPSAAVGGRVWLEFTHCGHELKVFMSSDGERWVSVAQLPGVVSLAMIGPYATAGGGPRSITIGAVAYRTFPRIAAVADAAARARLGAADRETAVMILEQLWRASLSADGDSSTRIALLDEIAHVAPTWDSAATAARVTGWYEELGRWFAARGDERPYAGIARAQQVAPLLCQTAYDFFPAALAREELIDHLVAGRWDELHAAAARAAFFGLAGGLGPLVTWAASAARDTGPNEWRHPVAVDLGKQAVAVVADIRAAVAEGDLARACEVLSAAASEAGDGLAVDGGDPDLSATVACLGESLVRTDSRFADAMRQEFTDRGQLRLRRAVETNDIALLASLAASYPGTVPAAEAHLLLGDRMLAAGHFLQARWHYGRAAGADADGRNAERLDLLDEIGPRSPADAAGEAARPLPRPGDYELATRGREAVESTMTRDGAAADGSTAVQAVVVAAGPRLLVSDGTTLVAHSAETGAEQWRWRGGDGAGEPRAWLGQSIRPVVSGTLAFVRRLTKQGATLAAIDLADGGVFWEVEPGDEGWLVASDPVVVGSHLRAVTATRSLDGWSLTLESFEPRSGARLGGPRLLQLRSSAGDLGPGCQLAMHDDSFSVVCAGGIVGCDPGGQPRWLRREPWLPLGVDPAWRQQVFSPPLVVAGSMVVVQPGVPAVVAVDPASGRIVWRRSLEGVRRLLGEIVANDQRLVVVERAGGLTAFDARGGAVVWQAGIGPLLDAHLVSPVEGVVACVGGAEPEAGGRVSLVWIDGATGGVRHRGVLHGGDSAATWLGPMVSSAGRLWCLRGATGAQPVKDLVEVVPHQAAP